VILAGDTITICTEFRGGRMDNVLVGNSSKSRKCGRSLSLHCLLLAVVFIGMFIPVFLWAQGPVRIHIEGVQGAELENVKVALALPEGLVRDGVVNERWLERFQEQIPEKTREALEPFGLYDPEVTVSSGLTTGDVHEVYVFIEPGEPVRVTSVTVGIKGPGEKEERLLDLAAAFPLHMGETLRHNVYESAKNDLRARAVELGYLDADFSTHEIRVTPGELKADIELVLQTGPLYYFGEIDFSGAPQYPQSFFGRYLEFKPGDVFSHEKVALTQRNLVNADRFRRVIIIPDKDEATADHRVPVHIKLVPSKPKRLRLGTGYETDIGIKGTIKYEDVNFFGTSHRFESQMDISQPIQVVGARYIIPHAKDTRSFSSVSFNMKREDQRDIFTESMTAEFERARTFGKVMTGSVFIQMLKERSEAGDDRTNTFSVLPGFRLSGIYYDNMIRPSRGYRYKTELKGTHQAIGSDTGLIQFTGDGGLIIPLPARLSLLTRGKIGWTTQNEPNSDLPIPLRFFAGGDQSVRGYGYKTLGPEDENGDVVGGKNLLEGSIELERAIAKDWGIAAFYDTGNAFNSFSDMRLAQGAGMGVRYYSPIGPIKLDIARQIGVKDPDFRIHISIGFGL
jgi:translocation and assembly module TamA